MEWVYFLKLTSWEGSLALVRLDHISSVTECRDKQDIGSSLLMSSGSLMMVRETPEEIGKRMVGATKELQQVGAGVTVSAD